MLKVAILNLESQDKLQYTLNCLYRIKEELIDSQIDLFIDKNNLEFASKNQYINQIIPLSLNNTTIFNFKSQYDSVSYYSRNKYHIAIDTQGCFKTAAFNYSLSGKTAGFKKLGLLNNLISYLFYDEKVKLSSIVEKEEKTKVLLSKTFGFEF